MRYAEIKDEVVTFVLPAILSGDYKVLPLGTVKLPLDSTVTVGMLYAAGSFRDRTATELKAYARPKFDAQRTALFLATQWVRERAGDLREMDRLGARTLTAADITLWKAWLTYWTTLRDMPSQPDFDPRTPVWPTQPE